METIVEARGKIPVKGSYDVIVVGGGTAGAIAGIAAAREGAKTLIVEAHGFLGGSATASLVTPLMSNHVDGKPLNAGIGLEVMQRLEETGDCAALNNNLGYFNWEMLKFVLEDMYLEAGGNLLYHAQYSAPIMEENTIKGIIVETKSGRLAIMGKVIIDASGDADVAATSGAPIESGDESGKNQAMSLRFSVANIDLDKFGAFLYSLDGYKANPPFYHGAHVNGKQFALTPTFEKAFEDGVLEVSDGDYFQFFGVPGRPNELAFNCPRISENTDATNVDHLTNAQIEGRSRIRRFMNFFKKYFPGFENAYISSIANMVGIRESRRVRGEYYLTEDDYGNTVKFPDGIAKNRYPIDVHSPKKGGGVNFYSGLKPGEYHEIPYRCLVPLNVENLLVVGRCISCSFVAQAAIRIEQNCHAFGEAAGVAAALALKENVSVRELDGVKLRDKLRENGANL
ncbi:MAG: FAD-dependent oxidoreductase [Firmicutes bacterium]|nr:FAD-dependent oxidoreductase [Bacillota bacterium]MDD4263346.1 FAD-dependent oxidoreductase [Bacillota bacterium]MDD4693076.1 FAD-dependent oxidoreductase [Bacillota bacterium]